MAIWWGAAARLREPGATGVTTSDWVVLAVGVAVLALGWAGRRPWGRWWLGGGEMGEYAGTLMFPVVGVAFTAGGLGMIGESSGWPGALVLVLGTVMLIGLGAALWVLLLLPVPDRLLVEGSSIRASRRRRQERRRSRRKARRRT